MSRLYYLLAGLRSLFSPQRTLRFKAGLLALVIIFSSLASILPVLPVSNVSAEPVRCEDNPDSVNCTNTKEKCEAVFYYWYNNTCNTNNLSDKKDLTKTAGWTSSNTVEATLYARALLNCMAGALNKASTLTVGDAANLSSQAWKDMLEGDGARGSLLDRDDDGVYNCENEGSWINNAKTVLQIGTNIELLCTLGWYRTDREVASQGQAQITYTVNYKEHQGYYDDCVNGDTGSNYVLTNKLANPSATTTEPRLTTASATFNSTSSEQRQIARAPTPVDDKLTTSTNGFISRLKTARGIDVVLSKAQTYLLYLWTLESTKPGCRATQTVKLSEADADQASGIGPDKKRVVVKIIEGEGTDADIVDYIYTFGDDRDENSTVPIASSIDGYPMWTDGSKTSPAGDSKNSCAFIKDVINDLSFDAQEAVAEGTLSLTEVAAGLTPLAGTGGSGDGQTTCVVDGVGWMVCPLMNALGGLNDVMYAWVESVLVLNPLTQTDSGGGPTPQYENWSRIRDIANVLLVVGFLAIIFSQITSIGISNYGVKKMLPRIVLIAIAINLSWVIMSLAVDVVNVLGVGLHALLDSAAVNANADSLNFTQTVSDLVTGASVATIAAGAGVLAAFLTASGGSTLVLLALPFILGAVLALLAAVATLFLRNALIIVLVIISPVAIVAYLLPNTEEYFKRWRKLFMSMLLLFPMAALLFAGAKFAAYVIVTSNQPLAQIAALFIMAAPLGMLPWLANSAGGILSTVNGRLGNMAKSIQGATQRGLQNRVETGRAERRAGLRNALGGRRDPNFKGRGTGETYGKDGAHYERGSDGKLKQVMHKAGDTKVDKEGVPLGKTRRTRRTGSQYFAERGEELKERTSTAQTTLKSNFQDRGLGDQGKPGSQTLTQKRNQRIAGVVDASKVAGLRSEGIEAQYKGRLEVAKLVDGEAKTLYDRLQDAGATTHALEEEQTLRQKDRLKSNVENTAAASIGLSRLEQVSAGTDLNISEASATRLNNLATASLEGGGNLGLKVLHENQEAAEQGVKTIDAQFEAELADRKKFGGNLFESAAAEAAYKAQAASAGKDFDAAIKELATKDTTDRKLRDRILGPKPDPSDIKANQDWETRAAQFDAAASTGGGEPSIRERLQEAATEDYINNSRIEQAEMDKKLGIDAEMQKDNELVRRAAGVGTEKRVRASAAKRLEADRQGDVSATEELLERGATSRDESLALLGMDIYGKPLFDEAGNFVYQGNTPEETQATWDNYVNGRKKIGQPLSGTDESNKTPRAVPNDERQLDGVEQEALLRRTIKQGDKKANVRPTLDFIRNNVKDAKKKRDDVYADTSSTQEQKDEADEGVKSAVRLQAAAIQQYASTPGALSPFLSSGDQGAMVDGTFERETDDLVINTFGSEKLGDPGFAQKWNIDHFKDAAGVFEDLAKSPDQLTPEERTAVDARLAQDGVQPVTKPADTAPQADKDAYNEYQKKFYKARLEKHFDDILVADGFTVPPVPSAGAPQAEKDAYDKAKTRRDKERTKRLQSFADARKGIDQVNDNEAFKPDGRAKEQIFKIRNVMDVLEEAGAIPGPSLDNGETYRRKAYTTEPGVSETTPSGQQVYLRQERDPNDTKGFVQKKYVIDENGREVDYVSGTTAPAQQPPTPPPSGGNPSTPTQPPAPLPPDNFVG